MTHMKRIVLCSDGTGNTSIKGRGTNVWKTFEAVDVNAHRANGKIERQIAFYDDGVGTEEFKLLKLLCGAFGFGIARNVKQLYMELCRAYAPGDEIYLFGFSRGAFTVRTLAGLIGECGIIDTHSRSDLGEGNARLTDGQLKKLVDEAYARFRKHFRRRWSAKLHQFLSSDTAAQATSDFRTRFAVKHPHHAPEGKAKVKFIGVWDTVDAIGMPVDEMAFVLNRLWPFKFPDLKLGDHVEKACHALAIDDERKTFHPVMWDETNENKSKNRIEQVWFSGMHCNVGGGYPKQGMSLVPLCWMMQKAADKGLRFLEDDFQRYSNHMNVDDKLYNSRAGLGMYYRYLPRNIGNICRRYAVECKIHASVLHRISLGTEGYAPGNLPGHFTVVPCDPKSKVPGEQPEAFQNLVEKLSDGCPKNQPILLNRVKPWVRVRVLAHYVLLLITVVALWLSQAGVPPDRQTTPITYLLHSMVSSVPLIGERLYALVTGPYAWTLAVVLAGLFVIVLLARRQMARIFSDFWRRMLGEDWFLEPTTSIGKSEKAA